MFGTTSSSMLIEREARAGLPRMRGSELEGEILIDQAMVNELLELRADLPDGVRIELGDNNQLVVRYGWAHATAVLEPEVDLRSSIRIRLRLSSSMVAWTLARALRVPFVHIDGRDMTIDIGALRPLAPWRPVWAHLYRATLTTGRGHVRLTFQGHVQG